MRDYSPYKSQIMIGRRIISLNFVYSLIGPVLFEIFLRYGILFSNFDVIDLTGRLKYTYVSHVEGVSDINCLLIFTDISVIMNLGYVVYRIYIGMYEVDKRFNQKRTFFYCFMCLVSGAALWPGFGEGLSAHAISNNRTLFINMLFIVVMLTTFGVGFGELMGNIIAVVHHIRTVQRK